jgi:hypothetical protein
MPNFHRQGQHEHDRADDHRYRNGNDSVGNSQIGRNMAGFPNQHGSHYAEQQTQRERKQGEQEGDENHAEYDPIPTGRSDRGLRRHEFLKYTIIGQEQPCGFACAKMPFMSHAAPAVTRPPAEVVRQSPVSQAPNGICYAISGEIPLSAADLERMVAAVPRVAAAALERKAYYFVPLTVSQGDETVIADRYDVSLSDHAVCHRNLELGNAQCVFISTRLMDDKFSIAFEFYINVGHAIVERTGVSQAFAGLVWKQVESGVRGETSLDAWESRKLATGTGPDTEKYKNEYFGATFADTISIYLLSLFLDVDYYDLRERDYPLLAPTPLAERLRKVAELFPANPGFEFAIYYKRRS